MEVADRGRGRLVPRFSPREPQLRIRWQSITIPQFTFASKPYYKAM